MNILYSTIRYYSLLFISLIVITLFFTGFENLHQQFTQQAQSFIEGKLDISSHHDTKEVAGKFYWPLGPFHSVLIMPFKLIYPQFNQSFMQLVLIPVLVFSIYLLAKIKNYTKEDSLYLTSVLLFGSSLIGIITYPSSWFYGQVIAFLLGILFLLEFETKKRFLILGLLGGFLILTRLTASFLILIPLFLYLKNKQYRNLTFFLIPIFIAIFLLGFLNFARFGNFLDTGYTTNNVNFAHREVRDLGFYSFSHIPSNLYYYFLLSVSPILDKSYHLTFPFFTYNKLALSLFITSPFFLYSLLIKKMDYLKFIILLSIIIPFVLNLFYYAPGNDQYGTRYALDFFPSLYLLLLYNLNSKLSETHKNLIVLSCLVNCYLLYSPFMR